MLPQASLCLAHAESFWPWRRWTEFSAWKDREQALVVLPVCGFRSDLPDTPLDAEEQRLTRLLAPALEASAPGTVLMLPPVRFVAGPVRDCAFTVGPELAHAQLEEICLSVRDSGFRRIVLVNASPWNEELCEVAARDLRIGHGLQLFVIQLRALGVCLAVEPGPSDLAKAAGALRELLAEIHRRPPLPRAGELVPRDLP